MELEARDCKHGALARECEMCELAAERDVLCGQRSAAEQAGDKWREAYVCLSNDSERKAGEYRDRIAALEAWGRQALDLIEHEAACAFTTDGPLEMKTGKLLAAGRELLGEG